MLTMTCTANSLQAVTAQIIALLWIFLQGQAQAKIYTSCLGRRGIHTTTSFCAYSLSTRCCYEKCCDVWDYSWSFTFSSCNSGFGFSYQTCKNGLSTNCCRKSYGGYSTCCYTSSTNWWSTTSSSSTNWWSTSSTTDFWDNGGSRGPSLGGIIGGVFGTIVIVIIIVVVSVICCGHRSAGRRGRVLRGAGNTNAMPMMAGTQPTTTTTVTHHPYPVQPPPGTYPNQYPQGPYPYPQGGPSYPQEPLQGSAPYPPSTGVYAPPPSYDSALNMQMGSNVTELRAPNSSESVPSAPYPPGPVNAAPYPTQPAGMQPPPPRY